MPTLGSKNVRLLKNGVIKVARNFLVLSFLPSIGHCQLDSARIEEVLARHETGIMGIYSIDLEVIEQSASGPVCSQRFRWTPEEEVIRVVQIKEDQRRRAMGSKGGGASCHVTHRKNQFGRGQSNMRLDLYRQDPAYAQGVSTVFVHKSPFDHRSIWFYLLRTFKVQLIQEDQTLTQLVKASSKTATVEQLSQNGNVRVRFSYPGELGLDGKRYLVNCPMEVDLNPSAGWAAERIAVTDKLPDGSHYVYESVAKDFVEVCPDVFIPSRFERNIGPADNPSRTTFLINVISCNTPFPADPDMEIHLLEGMMVMERVTDRDEGHAFHIIGPAQEYEKSFTSIREAKEYQYWKLMSMRGSIPQTSRWPKVVSLVATMVIGMLYLGYRLYRRRQAFL